MIDPNKIIKIISDQSGVEEQHITPESHLSSELNLSSIELVDLISKLTKEFRIDLPQDFDIESLKTVAELIQLVEDEQSEL